MSEISRDELSARLETVEARSETRFVELNFKIDRLTDSFSNLATAFPREIAELRDQMRSDLSDVKSDNKNTRWTITITIIASVIAGLGAFWAAQANLLTALQTGLAIKEQTTQSAINPTPPQRP